MYYLNKNIFVLDDNTILDVKEIIIKWSESWNWLNYGLF